MLGCENISWCLCVNTGVVLVDVFFGEERCFRYLSAFSCVAHGGFVATDPPSLGEPMSGEKRAARRTTTDHACIYGSLGYKVFSGVW